MVTNHLYQVQQFAKAILAFYSDRSDLETIKEQNFVLLKLFRSQPELATLFHDLTVLKTKKIACLNEILAIDNYDLMYQNGLKLFIEHNHSSLFVLLLVTIDNEVLRLLQIKMVSVTSAFALTPEQKTRLEAGWHQKLQSELVFEYQVVPELILGVKVRVDNYVEDYTLKSQIHQLKEQIKAIN